MKKVTPKGKYYIECDNLACGNNVVWDGTHKDYERVRVICIKNDWWFDLAGAYCPKHHRQFNKGVNPLWAEVYTELEGLTDEAMQKIFKQHATR